MPIPQELKMDSSEPLNAARRLAEAHKTCSLPSPTDGALLALLHRLSDPKAAAEADAESLKLVRKSLQPQPSKSTLVEALFFRSAWLDTYVRATFSAEVIDKRIDNIEIFTLVAGLDPQQPFNARVGWQCWGAGWLTDEACDMITKELIIELQNDIDSPSDDYCGDF
jgi:hypothetical protein